MNYYFVSFLTGVSSGNIVIEINKKYFPVKAVERKIQSMINQKENVEIVPTIMFYTKTTKEAYEEYNK